MVFPRFSHGLLTNRPTNQPTNQPTNAPTPPHWLHLLHVRGAHQAVHQLPSALVTDVVASKKSANRTPIE